MAGTLWEFFGYRATDQSPAALQAAGSAQCPFLSDTCTKVLRDGTIAGACTIKPVTSEAVICCPIRLYADDYKILKDVAEKAFGPGHALEPGRSAVATAKQSGKPTVAVFGKRWGGELRLPQRSGKGGYFVDWILAKIDANGDLEEFVAIEVQTIDTTGNYRNGITALLKNRAIVSTTAGLNWENVSKRILPQLIYKGQVLQRESLCKKGLFFVCPTPVYERIMERLGGEKGLIRYTMQPASITFMAYGHDLSGGVQPGHTVPLRLEVDHTTTVYKMQERFNNVELPRENVYRDAIMTALAP
ncbi:NotI family restriction endonuclease [Actinotalea sp. AC32]|nr:NotI family restriction endonuclease [Actinotalea sp. AC32]